MKNNEDPVVAVFIHSADLKHMEEEAARGVPTIDIPAGATRIRILPDDRVPPGGIRCARASHIMWPEENAD